MNNLLSTQAAADFFGVTTRTLKRWRKNGKLIPFVTVTHGGREDSFYTLEQLSQFREILHKTVTTVTNSEIHHGDNVTITGEISQNSDTQKAIFTDNVTVTVKDSQNSDNIIPHNSEKK